MRALYRPERRIHPRYTVAEANWGLRRFARLEERLLEIQCGWLHLIPELEVKIELGGFLYEDALHGDALRTRAEELFSEMDREPRPLQAEALEAICNEVDNATDLVERLTGLFRVLKAELLSEYRRNIAEGDDLLDAPTTRLLGACAAEEAAQVAWGERILSELFAQQPGARERAEEWERHLSRALSATGGLLGTSKVDITSELRNPGPPVRNLDTLPARDPAFTIVPWAEFHPQPVEPEEATAHLLQQAMSAEIDAAEVCGRVIADFPELPWKMKVELARQVWDEVRHGDMQWRRLEELGVASTPRRWPSG